MSQNPLQMFQRCALHGRSFVLLSLLASACAGGQQIQLAVREPIAPESVPALVPAAAATMPAAEGSPVATAAQDGLPAPSESSSAATASADTLPDSPSATLLAAAAFPSQPALADPGQFKTLDPNSVPKTPDNRPIAPVYTKYIPADWAYQPIHGREKFILGARDLYSPANIAAIFVSAGWSHLVDSQPNYGVNSEAFAKRLGAIAIRETAQGIFTDGVFAVMFHQDPRYFAEGPKYGFVHRALYAATRPIIVRTTNGTGSTVNSSLLAGYAATALLNNAYYPQINRNVKDTVSSFGTSIGGAALGFVASEFAEDTLEFLHLKRKP